ncbi:hypothetical protein SAMD00023353_4100300 [Rosellinia necatrix]|uniref:Uncharacterized protein n=1 Tax=Rosellinia necatrix TaxID=77044 RepID=A0A1W2TND1_ROSNE|nr:hypothetical protein SAMD00023353_4100300 [Rosellinia necatrix]
MSWTPPTATAAVSLDISSSASEIVVADTTTATTAPAITTATSGQPFGAGRTNGVQNATGNAISTQTTVTIAGGVIGGLALISIIAFLLWFWRKRIMKKRRSTLLTPLSTGVVYGGGGGGGEKGSYVISRNSLGPTTIPEKVRAMVGYNYHRLRGRVNSLVARSPKPSVDLNRGNSQFGLPGRSEMRSASGAGIASNEAATAKNRLVGWWGRLIEDSNLNWKRRGDPKSERPNNDKYTSMPKATQPRDKVTQPDFLTLLSMDEQQQQQQQQQRGGGSNPRRSQSLGNDHFLGGLGLNFDTENPFADSNAMSHDSAKVQPLTVSGALASDPFSDANAIPAPARFTNGSSGAGGPVTYVQNIRRSRGHSVSAANARPPSGGGGGGVAVGSRMPSLYRESSVSIETSDTRRNKFRSDPFDLDRPELLAQSPPPGPGGGGYVNPRGLPSMPRPARARTESLTSKYSSGVSSMAEWSDPGPDVGPAAGRWDTPSPDGALGRRQPLNSTSVDRGKGGGSQRSVGKAM